jgi:thymidylate synthase (FAD)
MSDRIDVLDHGYIRLIDSMGSDLSIVRAARVSHDADWRAGEDEGSDARLIRYLWKHRHSTPFEAVTVTFEVAAPIFVFRQWHRHRTQSYSEQSARYSELPETFYVPNPELVGVQSKNNKQARDLDFIHVMVSNRTRQIERVRQHNEESFALYRNLLSEGWPRELARTVLPVATYSRMFATANLLNWFRFLTLRSAPDAQYEIRVYADAMLTLLRPIAPVAVGAWEKV